jgi:hypothetical protein
MKDLWSGTYGPPGTYMRHWLNAPVSSYGWAPIFLWPEVPAPAIPWRKTWVCSYCGRMNENTDLECAKCGGPRRGNEGITWI